MKHLVTDVTKLEVGDVIYVFVALSMSASKVVNIHRSHGAVGEDQYIELIPLGRETLRSLCGTYSFAGLQRHTTLACIVLESQVEADINDEKLFMMKMSRSRESIFTYWHRRYHMPLERETRRRLLSPNRVLP